MGDNKNKALFVEDLVKHFCEKVTGENIDRVVGKSPEDKFFVGKLSTKDKLNSLNDSKSFIFQIGVDFFIKESEIVNSKIIITPFGEFYYRVNPSLQEQRKVIEEEYNVKNDKNLTYEEIFEEIGEEESDLKGRIVPVYKKIKTDDSFRVELDLSECYSREKGVGYKIFHKELTDKLDIIINEIICKDNNLYVVNNNKVTIENLKNEESWEKYLSKNRNLNKAIPRWDFSISVEISKVGYDLCRVSVYLVNESNSSFENHEDGKDKKRNNQVTINTIFNSKLTIKLEGTDFNKINLEYFADDYKYDKTQVAIGNNCSVEWTSENKSVLRTTNIPLYIQKRLKTKDSINVKFDDLVNNPVEVLNKVYSEMLLFKQKVESLKIEERVWNAKDIEKAKVKLDKEIQEFEFEIRRFKNGIEKIEQYTFINRAFRLMNEAFRNSSKGYDSWRLFQIVFIVSLIPDICVSEYGETNMGETCKIDDIDLLYFPTGGGKTEAFLGCTVFTAFFDRIRGKVDGVSAIIKYPLRLLSVQQVQRVADILASAERIRREEPDLVNTAIFSLGYYVGDKNTPNRLDEKAIRTIEDEKQNILNDKYKILDTCPFCGGNKIDIVLDKESIKLKHICRNKNCDSNGVIPIYIVDREVYRYLPTVIISTIDKIAAIGYQANFRNIFGEVTQKCPIHGYTSKKNKCTEDTCKEGYRSFREISIKDGAPSLIIQDELHLVREALGTFGSHYESAFQYMMSDLISNRKKVKIIGATATISSYEAQLLNLYGRSGLRFPCESPYINENFYSFIDEDEINRYIIGFAPYSKAIINSVVYSMKYLKEALWDYKEDPQKILSIEGIDLKNEDEALSLLENYWYLLEYNNVKQDANKVIGALETPINIELKSEDIQPFDHRKMTGDDSFQEVRRVLAEVENSKSVFEGFNLITATSMISHGVDADKFNLMMFFGMPGNTAEYIQAYSRVGRRFPGLVIVLLRPTREKDMSYLKNFVKFHEYKDVLVEPVPINKWASSAIYKTYPSIVQGLILNYYDKILKGKHGNLFMAQSVKRAVEFGDIGKDEMKKHILKSYNCIDEGGRIIDISRKYVEVIDTLTEKLFMTINSSVYSKNDFFSKVLEDVTGERVMNSLRDSEEQIKIRLD